MKDLVKSIILYLLFAIPLLLLFSIIWGMFIDYMDATHPIILGVLLFAFLAYVIIGWKLGWIRYDDDY